MAAQKKTKMTNEKMPMQISSLGQEKEKITEALKATAQDIETMYTKVKKLHGQSLFSRVLFGALRIIRPVFLFLGHVLITTFFKVPKEFASTPDLSKGAEQRKVVYANLKGTHQDAKQVKTLLKQLSDSYGAFLKEVEADDAKLLAFVNSSLQYPHDKGNCDLLLRYFHENGQLEDIDIRQLDAYGISARAHWKVDLKQTIRESATGK